MRTLLRPGEQYFAIRFACSHNTGTPKPRRVVTFMSIIKYAAITVFVCAISYTMMIAASTAQQQTAGQKCGTVFECAKLAVEEAAAARAALTQAESEIGKLRDQLNTYEARLKEDEAAMQSNKKVLDDLHNALSAAKWGAEQDSPGFRGAGDAPNLGSCAPGYYVVGVNAWASTARLGGGNIYQLQLLCRKLNVP